MKDLFEHSEWPQMRADLKDDILARVSPRAPAPWMLLTTPRARFGLAFSMIMCLVAGFVMENAHVSQHSQVPVTSMALAYYVRT